MQLGPRDLNVLGPDPHRAWAMHDSGPGLHGCVDQRRWQTPERVQFIAPSHASAAHGLPPARSSAPAAMNVKIGAAQAAPSAYTSASRTLWAEDALQHRANVRHGRGPPERTPEDHAHLWRLIGRVVPSPFLGFAGNITAGRQYPFTNAPQGEGTPALKGRRRAASRSQGLSVGHQDRHRHRLAHASVLRALGL